MNGILYKRGFIISFELNKQNRITAITTKTNATTLFTIIN